MRGALLIACLCVTACGRERLQHAGGELELPADLDFGRQYLDGTAKRALEVVNRGVAAEQLTFTLDDGPFTLASASVPAAGGTTTPVPLSFTPHAPGPASATLHATWSSGAADIALRGEGLAWPSCDSSDPCGTESFDPQAGRCVRAPLPDGTACAAADACLVATVCVGGACVGQARNCDDGDLCTDDSCSQTLGCVHSPTTTACTGDDPCKAYACDPQLGCVGSPLPDGTGCHTGDQCSGAGFCNDGSCVASRAPNGTPCTLEWAPCVADSTCTDGVCGSPTADGLAEGQQVWTWSTDAGTPYNTLTLLAVDDDGNSYVGDWETQSLTSLDVCGHLRWGVPLYGAPYAAMVAGSQLLIQENGVFSAIALSNGHRVWTVDDSKLFGYCPDGGSCGYSLNGGLLFAPPAMTNHGEIYLSATPPGPPWSLELAALDQNGTVQWLSQTGVPLQYSTLAAEVVDSAGNLYAYVGDGSGDHLWSFDTNGQSRFSLATFAQKDLAVGPGYVLNMGANPGAALDASGAQRFTVNAGNATFNSSAVIDDLGNITYWPNASINYAPGFQRFRADGTPTKSVVIPYGFAVSELALDAAGRVYAMGFGQFNDTHLWCWDGASASLDFDVDVSLQMSTKPSVSPVYDGSLFVTHGMVITDFASSVTGIFAGKKGLQAKKAWWSRGKGGANDNRHSPPF